MSEILDNQGRELQAQFFASHGRFEDARARKGRRRGMESRGPSPSSFGSRPSGSGKAAQGGGATKALEQVCGAACLAETDLMMNCRDS